MRKLLPVINCTSWREHVRGAVCAMDRTEPETGCCLACTQRTPIYAERGPILKHRNNSHTLPEPREGWVMISPCRWKRLTEAERAAFVEVEHLSGGWVEARTTH